MINDAHEVCGSDSKVDGVSVMTGGVVKSTSRTTMLLSTACSLNSLTKEKDFDIVDRNLKSPPFLKSAIKDLSPA